MRIASLLLLGAAVTCFAQDRLSSMPRYDRYERLRREIATSIKRGDVQVRWASDGKSLSFSQDGKRKRFELASGKIADDTAPETADANRDRRRAPERGRQFDTALSADGKMRAVCRDRNVYISGADGSGEYAVTTDGGVPQRIKNGVASWVYGEELGQREAMWWSPDSKKLVFYRFDESQVPDYFLTLDEGKVQNKLDVEAYPKAGVPNPGVELFVYDLASKKRTEIDVTFGDPQQAEYVYDVRWSKDGKKIWFNRTNRQQNKLEWVEADPETGDCRVFYTEDNPAGWVDNHLSVTWLPGDAQFLLISEKSGFRNIYLHDASGKLVRQLTAHQFEISSIARVDSKHVWYTARSGDTPYKLQLHRIGLDGKGDVRLTDPKFSHRVDVSPDGKYFVDVAESTRVAPQTTLRDAGGKERAILAKSDMSKFDQLGLKPTEQFTFTAADGKTTCYGYLQFPSDFDPSKKYPMLVSVYAGPESGGSLERFQTPNAVTELGFLHVSIEGRGTNGRGREFTQAVYRKLGIVEIDDQAAGVKSLASRPYVDSTRVGIYGTSYGGFASLMSLLRYPGVFRAASASSSVTDWRNYDTIYTERYMDTPQANPAGYEAGSAMTYANDLKGKLLLYWGTADNNVHPSNSLQFIKALSRKSFEISVGTDRGHSGIDTNRMWEFFIDHLVQDGARNGLQVAWKIRQPRLSKVLELGAASRK